jgi:hypothetical protein
MREFTFYGLNLDTPPRIAMVGFGPENRVFCSDQIHVAVSDAPRGLSNPRFWAQKARKATSGCTQSLASSILQHLVDHYRNLHIQYNKSVQGRQWAFGGMIKTVQYSTVQYKDLAFIAYGSTMRISNCPEITSRLKPAQPGQLPRIGRFST